MGKLGLLALANPCELFVYENDEEAYESQNSRGDHEWPMNEKPDLQVEQFALGQYESKVAKIWQKVDRSKCVLANKHKTCCPLGLTEL